MEKTPQQLQTAVSQIEGGKTPSESVRVFLSWFGAHRRGYWKVKQIRETLASFGLRTDPDFEYAFIDSHISILPAEEIKNGASEKSNERGSEDDKNDGELPDSYQVAQNSLTITRDPTYRIGKLASANMRPVSVSPDETVQKATTIMLSHDYSQLPVMVNDRDVKGMISWKSIGSRRALGRENKYVRECVEPFHEISADMSIFDAIGIIIRNECVLIRDSFKKISGIVTNSDLGDQFRQLSEPFLLLGQIENHIRQLIDSKFSKDDLTAAIDQRDTARNSVVADASDLTFGEYVRLLV